MGWGKRRDRSTDTFEYKTGLKSSAHFSYQIQVFQKKCFREEQKHASCSVNVVLY